MQQQKYKDQAEEEYKDIYIEVPDWPILESAAMPSWIGDFVGLATEHSEADPAAILSTFLCRFSAEVGRGPYQRIGDDVHRCVLFAVQCGATGKARKGTSAKPVDRLFNLYADSYVSCSTHPGPFSSGEGVIYEVRDEVKEFDKKIGEWVTTDPGIEDKRLFVLDEEFAGMMVASGRQGNTLNVMVRKLWDGGDMRPMTKGSRISATGAHICWSAHITLFELNMLLSDSDTFNGFANRILWICTRRPKLVALPKAMPTDTLNILRGIITERMEAGSISGEVILSAETEDLWIELYPALTSSARPGMLGAVTGRAEAYARRLAMVYCLLDGKRVISPDHLQSAMAFWRFCDQSAKYIFHGKGQDQVARKILDALQEGPQSGTDINRLFKSHVFSARLEVALTELLQSGCISREEEETGGRPASIYRIKNSPAY